MSPRRSLGYVMLEWTCPSCNTRNPGTQKTCRSCGAPQPDNVQFERAVDEKTVTDDGAISLARAGADFICPYCSTRNRGDAKVCVQCGGDLIEAKRRASGAELQANTGPQTVVCRNCGAENPASNASCATCGAPLPRLAAPPAPAPAVQASGKGVGVQKPKKPMGKKKWFLFGGIGAALLMCCVAAILLFVVPTESVQAKVADVHWETSVPVEEEHEVRHIEEEGNAPAGAYNVSCHTESSQVCTEKVVDQGNGFGEKVQDCEDVSKDYCSYTVKEWETIHTYTLDGHDYAPVYSEPSLTMDQRLGNKSVHYTVSFDTEKGEKAYSPGSLEDFRKYQVGTSWTLKLNAIGSVVGVGP